MSRPLFDRILCDYLIGSYINSVCDIIISHFFTKRSVSVGVKKKLDKVPKNPFGLSYFDSVISLLGSYFCSLF